ncbi:hypothetical protein V501_01503 [Pseudogymnoascus sp. VKM F-4519 (FW-2642)]|nr:hypothetical protein V501_01503 [Pseudogymnoascus sp. VKM F-4519 (FW-2642)]
MFDPEISQAFQTDSTLQGDDSTTQDPELIPLEFNHDTRHFARKSLPYPRLEIPWDLVGRSNTKGNSPATLHTWSVTHGITLDGTADCGYIPAQRQGDPPAVKASPGRA